jgi:predicted nucleic acid-binding protein
LFVDTNVLVQARFAPAPFHARARRALETGLRGGEPLRESRQFLREYLAVVTRPQTWAVPLPVAEALADLERLERDYAILEDGPAVTREPTALCRAVPLGGRQVHDANIVATMLAHGERRLLTFNLAGFARFRPQIELVSP